MSSISGPKRPHDRVAVSDMTADFKSCLVNKVSLTPPIQNYNMWKLFYDYFLLYFVEVYFELGIYYLH